MSEEVKRKFLLVTVSFLCRTLGMELKRTVQFPAHMDVNAKLTMNSIVGLRDDGVRKLGEIYGITQEGGWSISAESVTPLLIGIMTPAEFFSSPAEEAAAIE